MIKMCIKCNIEKNIDEFYTNGIGKKGVKYRGDCKKCRIQYAKNFWANDKETYNEIQKRWRDNNKCYIAEKSRRNYLKKTFNMTTRDYDEIYDKQNGQCKICGVNGEKTQKRDGPNVALFIDHDHETGKIRGLLCFGCNTGLGHFRDDMEILDKAIKYLCNDKNININ